MGTHDAGALYSREEGLHPQGSASHQAQLQQPSLQPQLSLFQVCQVVTQQVSTLTLLPHPVPLPLTLQAHRPATLELDPPIPAAVTRALVDLPKEAIRALILQRVVLTKLAKKRC